MTSYSPTTNTRMTSPRFIDLTLPSDDSGPDYTDDEGTDVEVMSADDVAGATAVATRESRRIRRWCFTFNNYQEADIATLAINLNKPAVKYAIVAREVAPGTGTRHLQGYLILSSAKTMSALKKFLGFRTIHLEEANGTTFQNIEYCSKEGKKVVFESWDLSN